jgi:uncharacterized protein (TIGR00255 family)
MTGYARASGTAPGLAFLIEVRSVNARGLDMRLRLAPGFDALDSEIRRRVTERFARGALSITLSVERAGDLGRLSVNLEALETVLSAIEALKARIDTDPPRPEGILMLKGVLEQHETGAERDDDAATGAILKAVDTALAALQATRRDEGGRIATVLFERITEITALTQQAEVHPARSRSAILTRLKAQVAELLDANPALPEERLVQEALLVATRVDIREELDRLGVHCAAARTLIAEGGPVGRKLDFLAQEFNREANTLCSKSNDVGLTAIGLDLKAAIDQLREQVQNIE